MSGNRDSSDVIIPAGSALIFEAPEGGRSWKLHNTMQGLVIEEEHAHGLPPPRNRPILTLTPAGAIVRGDLIVDGQLRREFDCRKFAGEWKVLEGTIPGDPDQEPQTRFAVIEHLGEGRFRLTYRREPPGPIDPPPYEYFLRFNPRTSTLDCEPGENDGHPDRCLSFWDGRARGGDGKHRIFAMRRTKQSGPAPVDPRYYLPWELDDTGAVHDPDNGTWGAEEGGG